LIILDNRLFFPATQRNKNYIGDVLAGIIKKKVQYWKLEVVVASME